MKIKSFFGALCFVAWTGCWAVHYEWFHYFGSALQGVLLVELVNSRLLQGLNGFGFRLFFLLDWEADHRIKLFWSQQKTPISLLIFLGHERKISILINHQVRVLKGFHRRVCTRVVRTRILRLFCLSCWVVFLHLGWGQWRLLLLCLVVNVFGRWIFFFYVEVNWLYLN